MDLVQTSQDRRRLESGDEEGDIEEETGDRLAKAMSDKPPTLDYRTPQEETLRDWPIVLTYVLVLAGIALVLIGMAFFQLFRA